MDKKNPYTFPGFHDLWITNTTIETTNKVVETESIIIETNNKIEYVRSI